MFRDYINFSIKNIKNRKLRSWLTIIGIIIGVAAIISLITISQGMQNAIEEQFNMLGTNRLFITPKGFAGPGSASTGLTDDDVKTLESMSEFEYVTPGLYRTAQIEFHDEIKFLIVQSAPAKDFELFNKDIGIDVVDGRMFRSSDKGSKSAVIGYRVAYADVFDDFIGVRNNIKINNQDFKVIGIMEEIGNSQDDNAINIDLDTYREIFNEPEKVDAITATVKKGINIENVKEKAEKKLERARGDENFQVLTSANILEQINAVLSIIQVVLVGIAAISLLVGSVGIMNSMYTSVLERTKEIGIMKSIGARNSDILNLFIIESAIIGFIGGIFGVMLGAGIAYLTGFIAKQAGFALLKIVLDYKIVISGLIFAVGLGILSGILPARQASKLKPVDALRYE
jgi:putative ABC transport system permease protein